MKKIFSLLAPLLVSLLIPWHAGAQSTEWGFATSWTYIKSTVTDAANATGYSGYDSYAIFDNNADVGCYSGFMQYAEGFPYLSIPSGTIVKGIEVSLEGYRSEGSDRQFIVTLFYRWTGGSAITGQRSTTDLAGSDAIHIVGSATDSWGLWSAQHIALDNFEVNVSVSGTTGTAYLDHIRVRVHYGVPVSPFVVTTPGEFTVPSGVSSLTAKAWGGGGGGSIYNPDFLGFGGGGGGYAGGTFGVNPGNVVGILVGSGGLASSGGQLNGNPGNPSMVTSGSNTLTAYGGKEGGWTVFMSGVYSPGTGGSGTSSGTVTNTSFFTGGNGATGSAGIGGGGGGGAGDAANGSHASGITGGAGGSTNGGNGGNGTTGDGAGGYGSNYGGGGAGASLNAANQGGGGGDGVVILSWAAPCPGAAVSVYNESGVTNSANILGQPDGQVATLATDNNGQITLDLTGAGNLAPGTTVTILWKKSSTANPLMTVEIINEINNSWIYIADRDPVDNTTLSGFTFTVTADARYLAFTIYGDGGEILEIDAVTYSCACPAPTPSVNVVNHCGYSVLTASGYTGDLAWNTGETTASITVNTAGKYWVSQKVGDCLSLSGWETAAPYTIPANPGTITGPANPCNSADAVYSISAVNGATGYVWTVPSTWTIKSGQNTESITVTVGTNAGNVSVKATTVNCEGPVSALAVTPDLVCCTATAVDRYEPNNTMQTATVLTVGSSLIWANILNPKDADWYSFLTAAAGSYKINLAINGESFAVYNDLGRKLKATDRTGTTFSLLANTTYYIKVSSRLKAPAACYSLGVAFIASSKFVVEDYEVLTSEEMNVTAEAMFRIWPNPSTDEFSFYNGMKGVVQVQVSDLSGRIVEMVRNVNPYETVRFGKNYPAGVYLVKATGGETIRTFKVVKQ